MSTNNETETGWEKIAIVIAVAFGPIFAEIYWQYQNVWAFLQAMPPLAAALVSAAGCAVGGWLYGRTPGTRFAAMVSAALMGFGCIMVFQLMHGQSARVSGIERWSAIGLGALPGLILAIVWTALLGRGIRRPGIISNGEI